MSFARELSEVVEALSVSEMTDEPRGLAERRGGSSKRRAKKLRKKARRKYRVAEGGEPPPPNTVLSRERETSITNKDGKEEYSQLRKFKYRFPLAKGGPSWAERAVLIVNDPGDYGVGDNTVIGYVGRDKTHGSNLDRKWIGQLHAMGEHGTLLKDKNLDYVLDDFFLEYQWVIDKKAQADYDSEHKYDDEDDFNSDLTKADLGRMAMDYYGEEGGSGSLSGDLREAVETLSIPEQITFLETLNERVTTALHTGWFTEETMEEAWVAILQESGATADDLDEVYEAIDEWLDEEVDLLERKGSAAFRKGSTTTEKTPKKMPPPKKKSIGQMIADPFAKKVAGVKTKTKTGKMLKHAAAGAIRQIGKKPGSAKEILKKSAQKAGKKLLRHAVKKGMKMVFGKWLKTEHAEMLDEAVLNEESLTEAIAPQSLIPILSRASGVELDKKAGEKLAKEFIVAMRNHIASEWFGEVLMEPETTKGKTIKTVDTDGYGTEVEITYEMPSEIESYDAVGLGIPQIVENMPSAKRILGHSGAIDLRRNLGRAFQSDQKLAKRIMEQAAQSTIPSWSAIATKDLNGRRSSLGDVISELINDSIEASPPSAIPSDYIRRRGPLASVKGFGDVTLTLKKLSADVGWRKLIKNPGGADVPVLVHSVWDVRGEVEVEADWDTIHDAGSAAGADARRYGSRWHDVFG